MNSPIHAHAYVYNTPRLLHTLSPRGKLVHWGLNGLAAKNSMQPTAKLNPDIAEWFKTINNCTASGADVVVNPYDNDYTSVQSTHVGYMDDDQLLDNYRPPRVILIVRNHHH
jgi:hypothetical protein